MFFFCFSHYSIVAFFQAGAHSGVRRRLDANFCSDCERSKCSKRSLGQCKRCLPIPSQRLLAVCDPQFIVWWCRADPVSGSDNGTGYAWCHGVISSCWDIHRRHAHAHLSIFTWPFFTWPYCWYVLLQPCACELLTTAQSGTVLAPLQTRCQVLVLLVI